MHDLPKLLNMTLESEETSEKKCEAIKILFELDQRYRKRKQLNKLHLLAFDYTMQNVEIKIDADDKPIYIKMTAPSVAVLHHDLAALKLLIEYGYSPSQALFVAFLTEKDSGTENLAIVRYLLTCNPYTEYLEGSLPIHPRNSTASAAAGRSTGKTLTAFYELSRAMELFLALPSSVSIRSEFLASKEAKDSIEVKKVNLSTYCEVLHHFAGACANDGIFVIDYLAKRLQNIRKENEKEKKEEIVNNNLFLVDFTKQTIRLLTRNISFAHPTHQHLTKTLLQEWQMHEKFAEILAYFVVTCANKKENISSYFTACLQDLRKAKKPDETALFLLELTKQIVLLLKKNAVLGSESYQFIVDLILKEWDTCPLPQIENQKAFFTAILNGKEPLGTLDKIFDTKPSDLPKVTKPLDEDDSEDDKNPLSVLANLSLVGGPRVASDISVVPVAAKVAM